MGLRPWPGRALRGPARCVWGARGFLLSAVGSQPSLSVPGGRRVSPPGAELGGPHKGSWGAVGPSGPERLCSCAWPSSPSSGPSGFRCVGEGRCSRLSVKRFFHLVYLWFDQQL